MLCCIILVYPKIFGELPSISHLKWSNNNGSHVRRREILPRFDVLDNWDKELEAMNRGKIG